MISKPKILFATPVLHHPPIGGPTLRIENSIKALAQISDLYIYCRACKDTIGGTDALDLYKTYCKGLFFASFVKTDKYSRFIKRAFNAISKRTLGWEVVRTGVEPTYEEFRHFLAVANDLQPDVIWLGYGNISYPLLKFIKSNSSYKVVIDTDSIWSRFVLRRVPFIKSKRELRRTKKTGKEKAEEERWGTQLADVTTAVSEIDADYYRSLALDPRQIFIFSNVIDEENYRKVPPSVEGMKRPSLYLAGSYFPRSAMDDAARWVIDSILPRLLRWVPDVHLYCVGRGSEQVLADIRNPAVTVVGQLDSVLPYLCHSDVALVPLRYESGTRFKILEAGACFVPVVSTTLGAEGLPVSHEKELLIADEPEEFARSVVRLLREREFALALAENLKTLVLKRYSIAALVQEGQRILQYLG